MDEKVELVTLRKDIFRLLGSRQPEHKKDFSFLEDLFSLPENEVHFAELKKSLDSGMGLKTSLERHSVLGPVYKALHRKTLNLQNYNKQQEVSSLVLEQFKQISKHKFENALDRLEKAGKGGVLSNFYCFEPSVENSESKRASFEQKVLEEGWFGYYYDLEENMLTSILID